MTTGLVWPVSSSLVVSLGSASGGVTPPDGELDELLLLMIVMEFNEVNGSAALDKKRVPESILVVVGGVSTPSECEEAAFGAVEKVAIADVEERFNECSLLPLIDDDNCTDSSSLDALKAVDELPGVVSLSGLSNSDELEVLRET
jgi:hypothetical protein